MLFIKSSLVALPLLALFGSASCAKAGEQQPLAVTPTKAIYGQITSAPSSSSSATCDFAPKPTSCTPGELAPFPFNCTMYWMCAGVFSIPQKCPNETVFNVKKLECEFKNITNCVGCCKATDCDKPEA